MSFLSSWLWFVTCHWVREWQHTHRWSHSGVAPFFWPLPSTWIPRWPPQQPHGAWASRWGEECLSEQGWAPSNFNCNTKVDCLPFFLFIEWGQLIKIELQTLLCFLSKKYYHIGKSFFCNHLVSYSPDKRSFSIGLGNLISDGFLFLQNSAYLYLFNVLNLLNYYFPEWSPASPVTHLPHLIPFLPWLWSVSNTSSLTDELFSGLAGCLTGSNLSIVGMLSVSFIRHSLW